MGKMSVFFVTLASVISATSALAAGGGSSIGVPNPASTNCILLGGSLEFHRNSGQESTYCRIEEWQLFEEMNSRGVAHLPEPSDGHIIGMPNPASVNCVKSGGTLELKSGPAGEFAECVIEEWQLFRNINLVDLE